MNKKSIPKTIICYLLALIKYNKISSMLEMSRALKTISHDALTDFIKKKIDTQNILLKVGENYYRMSDGWLIIDDTVIQKPHQKKFEGFDYIYDHAQHKSVKGIGVVMIAWTNKKKVVPLYFGIYQKNGTTKIKIALELLSKVRNALKLKPKAVLFDSWYASIDILKRIHDYGWTFISQLKKNRHVNGKKISESCFAPYMHFKGILKKGLLVSVYRNRSKYYMTNRVSLPRSEVLSQYKIRQMIEQLFKDLKSNFSLCSLSVNSLTAWENHISLCCIAYLITSSIGDFYDNKPSQIKKKFIYEEVAIGIDDINSFVNLA